MRYENSNTYARFDEEENFVEYLVGSLPAGVDREEIGDYTYYRVYMQIPENVSECPHNFRLSHEETPILETVSDTELKRATLRMVLVAKEGESLEEAQQATMQELRDERNRLLTETDFKIIVAIESGDSIPAEWKEYRQQLRDLTLTANVFNIVWPVAPE